MKSSGSAASVIPSHIPITLAHSAGPATQAKPDHKIPVQEVIAVHSFDFEGCIFHSAYREEPKVSTDDVLQINNELFKFIANDINRHRYTDVYIFTESLHQLQQAIKSGGYVAHSDATTKSLIGASLSTLLAIRDEISELAKFNCTLDSFLMEDIYSEKPAGFSFKKAMEESDSRSYTEVINDENKFNLLYVQMHKIAFEHKNADIAFHYYDNDKGILALLKSFFMNNPRFIPRKIDLYLHPYNGKEVTTYVDFKWDQHKKLNEKLRERAIIPGQGEVNQTYREVVKKKHMPSKEILFSNYPPVVYPDHFVSGIRDEKSASLYTDSHLSRYKNKKDFTKDEKFQQHTIHSLITDEDVKKKFYIDEFRKEIYSFLMKEEQKLNAKCCSFFAAEKSYIRLAQSLLKELGKGLTVTDLKKLKSISALDAIVNKYRDLQILAVELTHFERVLHDYGINRS